MGEIDSNTIIDSKGLNTPLVSMDRSSRQKINKEKLAFHDTSAQIDLIDIYTNITSCPASRFFRTIFFF